MKMTLSIKILLGIGIILISLGSSSAVKLNKEGSLSTTEAKADGEYKADISPELLYLLLTKTHKIYPEEPDAEKECLKLATKSAKYDKQLRELWQKVGDSITKNVPLRRDPFIKYLQQVTDEVTADNEKKDCQKLLLKNLIDEGELMNDRKQEELRTVVDSFFPTAKKGTTGKNIITAFIGPHRDIPNNNIFARLNGNA
jgi:hypothetical protein